jgi:hypothetical protein
LIFPLCALMQNKALQKGGLNFILIIFPKKIKKTNRKESEKQRREPLCTLISAVFMLSLRALK